jgi:hypothetical protein
MPRRVAKIMPVTAARKVFTTPTPKAVKYDCEG